MTKTNFQISNTSRLNFLGNPKIFYEDDLWRLDANLENFKNYLTIKCPNLEIPIQIDVVKQEIKGPGGELGWTKYEEVTFESK